MSLLSFDLQVNQQLNLMNSYQISRIYLIFLKDLNHPLQLYWVILMQYLNHGGQMTTSPEGNEIDSSTTTHRLHQLNIRSNASITKLFILH